MAAKTGYGHLSIRSRKAGLNTISNSVLAGAMWNNLLDSITVNSEPFLLQLQTNYPGINVLKTYFVTNHFINQLMH
jgi:hypothetical protein